MFLVGPSRSGTELMRAVLNRHPRLRIAPETHYFDDLRPRLTDAEVLTPSPENREQVLAYFGRLNGAIYGLDRQPTGTADLAFLERLNSTALAMDPGPDAIFAAFCQTCDIDRTKVQGTGRIWGEKTPRHIFSAAPIFTTFPNARMIVMVRDPRGVVASYRDWNNRWSAEQGATGALTTEAKAEVRRVRWSYSLTLSVLLWRSAISTGLSLLRTYGRDRVMLVKFEDLISSSSSVTGQVCDFLGIAPDAGMRQVAVRNSSYLKDDSRSGFVVEAAMRWRAVLSDAEIKHIERVAGNSMTVLGYAPHGKGAHILFSLREFAGLAVTLPRALWANVHRIGNLRLYLTARLSGLLRR